MKDNIGLVLLRILETFHQKKSKEFVSGLFQKIQSEFIPKDIAIELIDVLYSEESLLKTAILERVELEITRDSKEQRKELTH